MRKIVSIWIVLLMITSGLVLAVPSGNHGILSPFSRWGYAYDTASNELDTELITAWIDGVQYGATITSTGIDVGLFSIDVADDVTIFDDVKTGGYSGGVDTVHYVHGDLTDNGILFLETDIFVPGGMNPSPANLSESNNSPSLLKINNISTQSTFYPPDYIIIYNPTPNPVNASEYSLSVAEDVPIDITEGNIVSGLSGWNNIIIPGYGNLAIDMTAWCGLDNSGNSIQLIDSGSGFCVDRVEYGAIPTEPENSMMSNAAAPGPGDEIRRTGLGTDTNNCTMDFIISPENLPWAPQSVLLVDGDTSNNGWGTVPPYVTAITNTGANLTIWDTMISGKPTAPDMDPYDTVIWVPDKDMNWDGSAFDPLDEAEIASYLDTGGNFLLSNIAYTDYTDGTSYDYDPGDFAYDYLGLDGVNGWSMNEWNVSGIPGDEVYDGWYPAPLDWSRGGWGFPPWMCDDLYSRPGAIECIQNDDGFGFQAMGGVRYDSSMFRTVFFGFPFETLTQSDANECMNRTLQWFGQAALNPIINISKTVDKPTAYPTDLLTYTIYFDNTGSDPAGFMWINETIPDEVTYISDTASSVSGATFMGAGMSLPLIFYNFTNVLPGPHSFTITVMIHAGEPAGTIITNGVTCYFTPSGYLTQDWVNTVILLGEPDIWINPTSYDFAVITGQTDSDMLTVGNDGNAGLFYNLTSIAPWLSVSPDTGFLNPLQQANHSVNVDAMTLFPGFYQTTLSVSSNDPDESLLSIPVNLTVLSAPHDLNITDVNVDGSFEAGRPHWINGTILNQGSENETNVEIQFIVDFALENISTISSLNSSEQKLVTFLWTPPLAGQYLLSLFAIPVIGETIIGNNWRDAIINVTAEPDIWVSPTAYDFVVEVGQTDSDILTIGNNGLDDLDYSILCEGTGGIGDPYALSFDGSSDYVETPYITNTFNNHDFSIEAWVYPTTNPSYAVIYAIGESDNVDKMLEFKICNGNLEIWHWYDNWDTGITIETFNATHLVYVYTSLNKTGMLYKNGVYEGSYIFTGFLDVQNDAFVTSQIGHGYGTRFFNGTIDEVRILNTELTSAEVLEDYLADGHYPNRAGTVGWWHFNENNGTIAYDSSGNNNDGIIIGATWTAGIVSGGGSGGVDWLSVAPDNGTAPPFSVTNHTVTVNTTTLNPGFYQANITISSNDPDESEIIVPVNLTVLSAPHDVSVLSMNVVGSFEAGKPLWINGTILNQGIENETNVEVQFLVDFGFDNNTILFSLNSSEQKEVSFLWTPPLGVSYDLSLFVVPVPGETILGNNQWDMNINVTVEPDIWVSPGGFDFVLQTGQTDSDNLTIGNNGLANLYYNITSGGGNNIFLLDGTPGSTLAINALISMGFNVTDFGLPSLYNGLPDPSGFDVVILFTGNDWMDDMPANGQMAIENYVFNGGNIIITEWMGYHINDGRYSIISPMTLLSRITGGGGSETCTVLASHPITQGIPSPFTIVDHAFSGMTSLGGTLLLDGSSSGDALAYGNYGSGTVVQFATAGKYDVFDAWADPNLLQLLLNSAGWLSSYSGSLPAWLTVSPTSGIINPSGTQDHIITVNTTSLAPGFYYANITIISNDPNESEVIVPVNLTVLSAPHDLSVLNMSVEGSFEAGKPLWINGTILNQGFENETNVEVQFLVDFGFENNTIISSLNSSEQKFVSFLWVPPLGVQYTLSLFAVPVIGENITVNNWRNEVINVTAQPDIWVSPSSFDFVVQFGQTDSDILTIGNSGLADLTYGITDFQGVAAADGNYTIETTSYSWVEGVIGGTPLNQGDDDSDEVALPFGFELYGNTFNRVNVSSNGWVSFSGIAPFIPWSFPLPISSPIWVDAVFALGDDWNPGAGGDTYVKSVTSPNRFVITWDNVPHFGMGGSNTFQLVLFENGTMIFNYETLTTVTNWLVGVNKGDGVYGSQWLIEPTSMTSLLVKMEASDCPWLSENPTNGVISPFNNQNILVTVDATMLNPGFYQANISVASNDPGTPQIIIPVNLTVIPADHDIAITNITASSQMDLGDTIPINATLKNQGLFNEANIAVQLREDGFILGTNVYSLNSGTQMPITFDYTPVSAGTFNISIYAVPVPGENVTFNNLVWTFIDVIAVPVIWVTPSSYDIVLTAGEVGVYNLTVGNSGLGDLNYTITDDLDSTGIGNNPILNPSFETGDFTDWIAIDMANPYIPLQVTNGFWPPTNGSYAMVNGFDGGGPDTITVAQDVNLPQGSNTLEFDYRAEWNNVGTLDRIFYVDIEPSGGGSALQSVIILVALAGTSNPDTGNLHGVVDVSAFEGSSIRISFEWFIPEFFTGPAGFQLDNVVINGTYYDDSDWLSEDPTFGVVPPLNDMNVLVTANATRLDPGFYQANISVASNDPSNPVIIIPVNLTVLPPDHDVKITDITAPSQMELGDTIPVNATLKNQGLFNEPNIAVELREDGLLLGTNFYSLNSGNQMTITFDYTPTSAGTFNISLNAVPVPGETIIFNNLDWTFIDVIAVPDIWVMPFSYDVVVMVGETYTDSLTIGNDGFLDLDYQILLGGNYTMSGTSPTTTGDISDILFYDQDGDGLNDTFDYIYIYADSSDDDTLIVTVNGWNGTAWTSIYSGSGGSRVVVDGYYLSDGYTILEVILDDTENNDVIYYDYDFTLLYGSDADWLSVSPLFGNLLPFTIFDHLVTINATLLAPGFYQANITILSNDPGEPSIIVPVNLTVIFDDIVPPQHSNEHPGINISTEDVRPTIWVHVTDNVEVNVSTIRLYVMGFPLFYDISPIPGGYNISYTHSMDYPEGAVTVRIVARDTFDNLMDFTWVFYIDLSPPIAWDIDPPPGGMTQNLTPKIRLNVTDASGFVVLGTMRLYVQNFPVWFEYSAIPGGFHLWYVHSFGFVPGEVVSCRIRAEDNTGHWLDYFWNFTIADVLTVQIPVQVGWNLISFPLIPYNTSLPVVLQDLDGDTTWENIQWYDPLDTADHWKTYSTFKPPFLNDLTDVTRSMSVWLYIPDAGALGDGLIKITGLESVSTNIPLYAGWNLVGYPSQVNRTVQDALAGTGYDGIEGFNASAPYLLSPLDDTYLMKTFEGYWIHVPVDTIWIVDW